MLWKFFSKQQKDTGFKLSQCDYTPVLIGRYHLWRRHTSWLVLAYVRTLRESTGSSCRCTVIWSMWGRSVYACCSTCTPRLSGRRTLSVTLSTVPGDVLSRPVRHVTVRGSKLRHSRSTAVTCRPSRLISCPGLYHRPIDTLSHVN